MPEMPLVTLVLANGPGFPQGSADHRYEISVALSQGGYLTPEAWLADPAPWPAVRFRPDGPPMARRPMPPRMWRSCSWASSGPGNTSPSASRTGATTASGSSASAR
jgi:hypothetical protein